MTKPKSVTRDDGGRAFYVRTRTRVVVRGNLLAAKFFSLFLSLFRVEGILRLAFFDEEKNFEVDETKLLFCTGSFKSECRETTRNLTCKIYLKKKFRNLLRNKNIWKSYSFFPSFL